MVMVVDFMGANPETDDTGDEALGVQVGPRSHRLSCPLSQPVRMHLSRRGWPKSCLHHASV